MQKQATPTTKLRSPQYSVNMVRTSIPVVITAYIAREYMMGKEGHRFQK